MSKYYKGRENQATIDHLLAGETVIIGGSGATVAVTLIFENTKN